MERLERVVVQLIEARRLADFQDVSHGRLALLLLDNAAETLLRQRAEQALIVADFYGNALRSLADIPDTNNPDLKQFRAELEVKSVSERTRQDIARNFSDLVRYVASVEDSHVGPELAKCLNALHRYRNDAYHQNKVRADVLDPSIEIYFYLCCVLLKDQKFLATPLGEAPEVITKAIPGLQNQSGWVDEKVIGDAVADHFLAEHQLDHGGIQVALANHLLARVHGIERNLDEFIDYVGFTDKATALRSIQLLPLSGEPPAVPDDYWMRPIVVTDGVIQSWRRRSAEVNDLPSAQEALGRFDEIEKAVTKFEAQLEPFMIAMDGDIQNQIDEMRGK